MGDGMGRVRACPSFRKNATEKARPVRLKRRHVLGLYRHDFLKLAGWFSGAFSLKLTCIAVEASGNAFFPVGLREYLLSDRQARMATTSSNFPEQNQGQCRLVREQGPAQFLAVIHERRVQRS